MSIRALALELYRAMKEVESLEKRLKNLSPTSAERDELERRLWAARSERDRIKRILEGAKD